MGAWWFGLPSRLSRHAYESPLRVSDTGWPEAPSSPQVDVHSTCVSLCQRGGIGWTRGPKRHRRSAMRTAASAERAVKPAPRMVTVTPPSPRLWLGETEARYGAAYRCTVGSVWLTTVALEVRFTSISAAMPLRETSMVVGPPLLSAPKPIAGSGQWTRPASSSAPGTTRVPPRRQTSCPTPKSANPEPLTVTAAGTFIGTPIGETASRRTLATSYSVKWGKAKRVGSKSTPFCVTCTLHLPAVPLAGEAQRALVALVTVSAVSIDGPDGTSRGAKRHDPCREGGAG